MKSVKQLKEDIERQRMIDEQYRAMEEHRGALPYMVVAICMFIVFVMILFLMITK